MSDVHPDALRKQIHNVTTADLEAFPIWSSVLEEEGRPGQDELTVRPRPDLLEADPYRETLFVRCEFVARNGTRYDGYCTPSHDGDPGHLQPTIVTESGQVPLWHGIRRPSREDIDAALRVLGASADEIFPLAYRPRVPCHGIPVDGRIEGFMYLASLTDERSRWAR